MISTSRTRRPSSRRVVAGLGAGALALTATLAATGAGPAQAAGRDGSDVRRGPDVSAQVSRDRSPGQTSDGVRGADAQAFAPRAATPRTITTTPTAQWTVSPGVTFTRFDRLDSQRGNVRAQLLTVDLTTPGGLSLDYTAATSVSKVKTVDHLTAIGGGVAGINGDFFDIGDTGAALGIGSSRGRGLVQGPLSGWNSAFWIDGAGKPAIGTLAVETVLKQKPRFTISALNPPSVPQGGIAAYDKAWGTLDGLQVTDRQRKNVRQVVIRNKRVVSNSTRLTRGRVDGQVLIGRGKGAKKLGYVKVGSRAVLRSSIPGSPPVAITGNRPLLLAGIRQVIDDREMHPRTAIGIDRDTNRLLLLVVDGRQATSRGMTMVELAQWMTELGAEDALNLDGGGSSTMMARDANGVMGVQNSPSDGSLRKVANGLVVTYNGPPAPVPAPTPAPTPPPTTPAPAP